eukprot:4571937-Pleurochrysis_carterae.AAC.2
MSQLTAVRQTKRGTRLSTQRRCAPLGLGIEVNDRGSPRATARIERAGASMKESESERASARVGAGARVRERERV